MSAPEIILLILCAISLLLGARNHGKPETGYKNFWATFIGWAIQLGLLYWAGLFH